MDRRRRGRGLQAHAVARGEIGRATGRGVVQGRQVRRHLRMSATTSAVRWARERSRANSSCVPWHQYTFHRCTGEGEPGYEADKVPSYGVQGRERPAVGHREAGEQARPPAARAASADARRPTRAPGPLRVGGISTTAMDPEEPALLHLRTLAERRAGARGRGARRRDANDPAQRPASSATAKAITQGRQGLHLAVLDHLDGPDRPARPGLRDGRALGRHPADRHADPLGRGELALLQDGRAHELHPEPDHPQQQGADPEQGGGVHHHRRPGRHPGGGRADDGFFSEIGYLLPQFPFIAHSLGWEFEEMERNVEFVRQRAAARRRARAGERAARRCRSACWSAR